MCGLQIFYTELFDLVHNFQRYYRRNELHSTPQLKSLLLSAVNIISYFQVHYLGLNF